jgi:hypothetical protein
MSGSVAYNGWTCGVCRQFVPNGCVHSCPTGYGTQVRTPPTVTRTDWTPQLIALGSRIADLLERLVTALEKRDEGKGASL